MAWLIVTAGEPLPCPVFSPIKGGFEKFLQQNFSFTMNFSLFYFFNKFIVYNKENILSQFDPSRLRQWFCAGQIFPLQAQGLSLTERSLSTNNQSFGCYVIDSDYNIVNMNSIAKEIYPQLAIGKKCYKC